jgi:hypothetical protein
VGADARKMSNFFVCLVEKKKAQEIWYVETGRHPNNRKKTRKKQEKRSA